MGVISQAAKGAAKGAKTATKRMSKAEAEAAGLWHPVSDIKLRKPVSEIQRTVVKDPEAQMLERRVITPEEMQGGVAIPLVGDRAAAGRLIQEIEGTPMNVKLEGGPDFMRLHPGMAWASGQGVLSMLADRIRMARESGNPIYGVYTAMGPQAVDFNTMVTESLLNQLDVSGLRKADIKAFNEAVRQVKGQGNKPKAPNFVGIDHPDFERELMEGPGGQRDAFVKTMAKAKFQKAGFPDVAAARTAVIDPELMDVERGSSGFTVARLDPEAGIEEMSGHKTYPFDLRGEYVGGLEQQLPVDVMYPTHFGAKRLMGKEEKDIHKSLELTAPLQYLEQEWLDNAMKYLELQRKIKEGRAKGGLVSPEGIPPIATDLEAEFQQYQVGGAVRRAASAASKVAKKSIPPTFGGSYDNLVLRKAKEEFATTYGMDVGQGLSKDYDFVDINRITPSEKVNEDHVKELMSALKNEDPFNTKVPPIIIDSEGNVLDGHHRVEAAKRLGIKSVPAIEKFEIKNGTKIIDTTEEHKANGGSVESPEGIPPIVNDLEAEFRQYQIGGAIRRAAAAAAKRSKGLGEKAAEKTSRVLPDAERAANKEAFLAKSKDPQRYYHGTVDKKTRGPQVTGVDEDTGRTLYEMKGPEEEGIREFSLGEREMVFLSPMAEFSNSYARTPGKGYEGGSVYPVRVQTENPFDFRSLDQVDELVNWIGLNDYEPNSWTFNKSPRYIRESILSGDWGYLEDPLVRRGAQSLGHDAMYLKELGVVNLGVFDPKRIKSDIGNQGTFDITDPDITKAEGGSVRLSDDIRSRLAQKMGFAEGGSVEGWKDRLAKKMAEGGAVKMAEGGDLPQDELAYMAEALSPERESEDSETAKKIRAAIKAGKVIATALPKALVSPVVGLYGTAKSGKYGTREGVVAGEKAMEEFMEPSEETIKELEDDPLAMGYLQNIDKFMEELETKYKLPPLMPQLYGVATGTRGVIPQVKGLAKKGAAKAKKAVSEVPTLPVGLSMEPVGKPVSQVISEAKPGKIKVEANEAGFYSPIEKAVVNLQRKQGPGQAFLSDIMKFNPSKGELEATGIADWLKDKQSVTKQEVMDYINQNKVQIEEVVRGTILDDVDRQKLNDINRRISREFVYTITPEEEEWFEATRERLAQFKDPRFEREGLILPGGKNYKEILLKLPQKQEAPKEFPKQAELDALQAQMAKLKSENKRQEFGQLIEKRTELLSERKKFLQEEENRIERARGKPYQSSHWPDDPNTLAHMRVQDMKINGKKTLMIEEIQSDWHQQGREQGYVPKNIENVELKATVNTSANEPYYEVRTADGQFVANIVDVPVESGNEGRAIAEAQRFLRNRGIPGAVPDAPFKKDWYQLAIKRLFKYAADNDYDQIALVGPEEQIRRGSLGTHIDGLFYEKAPDGSIKLEAEKNGKVVLDKVVKADDLELYVGKDVAKRIIQSDEKDGTLSGDDLKIGGEGMRQYYDRSYPDSMNKIGKKYGAKLEKRAMTINEYGPDDVETVQTGEADRFGREVIAYKVVDPETDKVIAYEYDFDKALREANKLVPQTSYWLMDLSPDMKKDVRIGQPFKKGGAVKMRNGGPIVSTYNTIPDFNDSGAIKLAAYEQELKKYA